LIRLHFVVEGQTEETFVNQILAPELDFITADAHKITTGRKRGTVYRGGFLTYHHLKNDLVRWIKQDRHSDARFTTMVDLYGLPGNFPSRDKADHISDPMMKAELLESALYDDIGDNRLIPYIQIHEFEALLFSEPDAFSSAFPACEAEIAKLKLIRSGFESPEHINDGAHTAPSKRICQLLPSYVKTSYGLTIAEEIGLAKMRAECRHFDRWVSRLRTLQTALRS